MFANPAHDFPKRVGYRLRGRHPSHRLDRRRCRAAGPAPRVPDDQGALRAARGWRPPATRRARIRDAHCGWRVTSAATSRRWPGRPSGRLSSRPMTRGPSDSARLAAGVGGDRRGDLAVLRAGCPAANAATVSTALLMVVLLVAASSRLWVAVTTSVVAMLAFNIAFLPPVGTLVISDPQNWVALVVVPGGQPGRQQPLGGGARPDRRSARAGATSWPGSSTSAATCWSAPRAAMRCRSWPASVARRFDLAFVAIALPRGDDWDVFDAGALAGARPRASSPRRFAAAQTTLEFDAYGPHLRRSPDDATATAATCGSCRCGSARGRSACSPPPAGRSKPARSTRWPAWWPSASSGRSCSRSARPASWPARARS